MWMHAAAVESVKSKTRDDEPPPASPQADRNLVHQIAHGDADALATLYDRHIRSVFSLAIRIVEDQGDAEDVVQEVFSQAWEQAARYDAGRGSVVGWLLVMTRSRAIDRRRARGARPDGPSSPDATALPLPDPARAQDFQLQSDEEAARLRAALYRLPFLQRVAIELAYYEGLTQMQIAERLEQPLGTVKTRIRTGLLKLREALGGNTR